jgi:hypothetical protein
MPNPLPRSILPDTWAAKTRCPICSASALHVQHLPAAPDQMVCRMCQSSFEIEEHGAYLRFIKLAQPLAGILANRWVTMVEVKEAITRARREVDNSQPVLTHALEAPPRARPLTDNEVLAKAKTLHKLGSSPGQVAAILAQNSLITPEQILQSRSALAAQDEHKARRQNRIIYFTGGAAILLVIVCLMMGFLAQFFNYRYTREINPAIPTDTIRAIIPEVIQESADGAVAPICPLTHADAARLFGGLASDWTKKNNGWSYLTTPQASVHVPKGMSALLLLDVNLHTVNVVGPATINNVFAITIFCR